MQISLNKSLQIMQHLFQQTMNELYWGKIPFITLLAFRQITRNRNIYFLNSLTGEFPPNICTSLSVPIWQIICLSTTCRLTSQQRPINYWGTEPSIALILNQIMQLMPTAFTINPVHCRYHSLLCMSLIYQPREKN